MDVGKDLGEHLAEAVNGGGQAKAQASLKKGPDLQRNLAPKHGVDVERRQISVVV